MFASEPIEQPTKIDLRLTEQESKSVAPFMRGFRMLMILLAVWVVAGLIAFIMSIVCMGRSGTMAQHIIGILLAIFLGPCYWIYYALSKSYCVKGGQRR